MYDPISVALLRDVDLKILFFAMEEDEETFYWNMYSYLLARASNYTHRYDMRELCSYTEPFPESVEEFIRNSGIDEQAKKYKSYIDYYDRVTNPTGIYKEIRKFAVRRGSFLNAQGAKVPDKEVLTGNKKNLNKYHWKKYVPDNPSEFVIVVIDHLNIVTPEKNSNTLSLAMGKTVEYMVHYVAKHYGYSVCVVHQQSSDRENLDHIKENHFIPSRQGLGDNKRVGRDYKEILGLYNPKEYGVKTWPPKKGYDLTQLHRYSRFVTVAKQRMGDKNKYIPLFFDGKTGMIESLPSYKKARELQNYEIKATKFKTA